MLRFLAFHRTGLMTLPLPGGFFGPHAKRLHPRVAADRAARGVTTALAVARAAAVMRGARARVTIAADTLWIDCWEGADCRPYQGMARPDHRGCDAGSDQSRGRFGTTGVVGASNTQVVLHRGSHAETITTSRLGRVKRW